MRILLQVVALTGSPGVGRGGTLENAVNHTKKLSFHLDVDRICTVKENKEDLRRYISEPSHGMLPKLSETAAQCGVPQSTIQR